MTGGQGLRLAALTVGLLSLVSFFLAPGASFLAAVFGVLSLAIALGKSRIAVLVFPAQILASLVSLYFLSEALALESPGSLLLGVTLSAFSILMVYVESKLFVLRSGIGVAGAAVLAAVSAVLVYALGASQPALEELSREWASSPLELVTYGGLLYVAASLPYSSMILFGMVYLAYDLLRSVRPEELFEPV